MFHIYFCYMSFGVLLTLYTSVYYDDMFWFSSKWNDRRNGRLSQGQNRLRWDLPSCIAHAGACYDRSVWNWNRHTGANYSSCLMCTCILCINVYKLFDTTGKSYGCWSSVLRHCGSIERQVRHTGGITWDVRRANDSARSVWNPAVFALSRPSMWFNCLCQEHLCTNQEKKNKNVIILKNFLKMQMKKNNAVDNSLFRLLLQKG